MLGGCAGVECCNQPAEREHYSQTKTYYRNKAAAHCYFCSNLCKIIFDATRKCHMCGYYNDLVRVDDPSGGGTFMVCTSAEHWHPCHSKYLEATALREVHMRQADKPNPQSAF